MPDINLIQEVTAELQALSEINVELQSEPYTNASFGNVYIVEADNRVLYATKETWDSIPQLQSRRGFIYIYSNWKQDDLGRPIAGCKFGDGNAYLIDIPFKDDMWWDHINDAIIHVTPEEKEFWNNKVTCYITDNGTNLVFSKQ